MLPNLSVINEISIGRSFVRTVTFGTPLVHSVTFELQILSSLEFSKLVQQPHTILKHGSRNAATCTRSRTSSDVHYRPNDALTD